MKGVDDLTDLFADIRSEPASPSDSLTVALPSSSRYPSASPNDNDEKLQKLRKLLGVETHLHGQRPPNIPIDHEKPEHRLILFMKAEGYSNRECAIVGGYSDAWVSQVTRQPWFVKRLMEFIDEAGKNKVKQLLEATLVDSIFTLVEIRDDPKTPSAVKARVSDSLIDRVLGKPKQSVEIQEKTPVESELSAIDEELAMYEKDEFGTARL